MNQIEIVGDYIQKKFSHFKKKEDNLFTFSEDGKERKLLIVTEKLCNGKSYLFSENFELLLSKEEEEINADYFAFCFGKQYYYIKDPKKPKFNIFRYLGKYEVPSGDFGHLGLHTTFSLLRGCQKIEDYLKKANYLSMSFLGICERNTLNSCLKFQTACAKYNVKSIIGEEIKVKYKKEIYYFKLFVKNEKGWINLLNLSNVLNVFKKEEGIDFVDFSDFCINLSDLIVILPNNFNFKELYNKIKNFDCYYQVDTIEFLNKDFYSSYLQNIKDYRDFWSNKIPPVLIGDSFYLDEEDKDLCNTIRQIGNYSEFEYACKSQHFKSVDEHIEIFSKFWENKLEEFDMFMFDCINNTKQIADKCNFRIEFEKLHIPDAIISVEEWNEVFQEEMKNLKGN